MIPGSKAVLAAVVLLAGCSVAAAQGTSIGFFPGGTAGKRMPAYLTGGIGALSLSPRVPTKPFGYDMDTVGTQTFTWVPANTLFPSGQRTNSETIVLNKPGSLFQPRWNQLDVNLKKNVRNGKKVFTFEVECFNVLNANAVFTTNNAIGGSLGQVTTILMGRLPRLSFQMKF